MKKRVTAILLAMSVMFTMLAFPTSAATAASNFEFSYGTITKYIGKATTVEIPSKINGLSVTSIDYFAFSGCTSLTSVTIPSSVTSIGGGAFEGCTKLKKVAIPSSVTYIDSSAFSGCTSLEKITVGSKNKNYSSSNGVLFNKDKTTLIQYPEGKTSSSYTIPSGVTYIDSSAFSGCTSLTSVTIPSSVTSIGYNSFSGCTSLTSVTIPDSVTVIDSDAFSGCTRLTKITVSSKNKNYSASNGVLFNKDKTILIKYPAGKTSSSYTIPSSVTTIGYSAFEHCSKLKSVTIPDSVTVIRQDAFSGCTSLTSVAIPSSVTDIVGYNAFSDCTNLTKITVSSNNKNYSASNGVLFSKDKTNLLQYPAGKTSSSYTIPSSVTYITPAAFDGCTNLTKITVSSKNKNFSASNGVLFNKDKTALIQYPAGKTASSYTIPSSVTRIDWYAFEGCTKLKKVAIPSSVTWIDQGAFSGCTKLASVTIPSSVTYIGNYAFEGCTSLVIYGKKGSEAQNFAEKNGFTFKVK